jgi:hypothetical protein
MTPAKYRAFARECLELAEETEEEECARALFEVCKTLLKAALRQEAKAVGYKPIVNAGVKLHQPAGKMDQGRFWRVTRRSRK